MSLIIKTNSFFSVLMSIYYKEIPSLFNRAMHSIWDEQAVRPSQIVLVQDGPLTVELYSVISEWQKKLGEVLTTVPLEKNVGLGDALNIGLQHCNNELVARMDTDDIAHPQRFEKQLAIFSSSDVDICSSWITEFDNDESVITGQRKLPEKHEAIALYAKTRCPINHPAVMYKKAAVEKAGGYKKMMWFEDYYLWVRMLLTGAKFYNIQETLVHMQAGLGQLERRSGRAYAKSELALLIEFKKIGFLTSFDFLKIACMRVPIRLMPKSLIRLVYKVLR